MLPDQAGGEDRCRDTGESWGSGGKPGCSVLRPPAGIRDPWREEGRTLACSEGVPKQQLRPHLKIKVRHNGLSSPKDPSPHPTSTTSLVQEEDTIYWIIGPGPPPKTPPSCINIERKP